MKPIRSPKEPIASFPGLVKEEKEETSRASRKREEEGLEAARRKRVRTGR